MQHGVLLAPAVAESFSFAKSSGQTMAIAMATATACSKAASNNRQAAATAFAATAVSSVEQGVVETFAKSQVNPLLCHRIYVQLLRQARRLDLLAQQHTVLPYWHFMTFGGCLVIDQLLVGSWSADF
jgi:hypothetical protein